MPIARYGGFIRLSSTILPPSFGRAAKSRLEFLMFPHPRVWLEFYAPTHGDLPQFRLEQKNIAGLPGGTSRSIRMPSST